MSTKARFGKLALAVGLGAMLASSAITVSMAQSPNARNNAMRARAQAPYADPAVRAYGYRVQPNRPGLQPNGPGPHYYEGDDNGSVWSYYQGYQRLR